MRDPHLTSQNQRVPPQDSQWEQHVVLVCVSVGIAHAHAHRDHEL